MFTPSERGYFFPIVTGAVLALVFVYSRASPLLFVGFAPALVFFSRAENARRAFLGGFCVGFVYCGVTVFGGLWPSREAQEFLFGEILGASPWWTRAGFYGIAALVFSLCAALLSIPYALWGVGSYHAMRRNGAWWVVAVPALWVLAEFLRRKLFFDLSWFDIGYGFVDYPSLAVLARLSGKYGLAFIAVLISAFVVAGWRKLLPARRAFVAVVLFLGVVWSVGYRYSQQVSLTFEKGTPTRVAVLQGYVGWESEFPEQAGGAFRFPKPYEDFFTKLQSSSDAPPDIILLPEELIHEVFLSVDEYGFPVNVMGEATRLHEERDYLLRLLRESGASLIVFGQPTQLRNARFGNTFLVFDRDGRMGAYTKQKLFPFFERPPFFHSLLGVPNRAQIFYSTPRANPMLHTSPVNVFLLSCVEIESDEIFHRYMPDTPSIVLTGGSEIGFRELGRRAQLRFVRFRAIEQDRYIARATKRGWSAIADPLGREIRRVSKSDANEMLMGDMYARGGKTPYARVGDGPIVVGSALLAGVILAVHRKKERSG